MEIWKDIKGYENLYQVSNLGRVKGLIGHYKNSCSKLDRILKISKNKFGYLVVNLHKKNKRKMYFVHRLVAETFIDNTESKQQVNHIDGNKQNNNIKNLEWVTQNENMQHAYKLGLKVPSVPMTGKLGNDNPTSIGVLQYDKNNNFIKEWGSRTEVERELGIHHSSIGKCCRGELKTSGGFIWRDK